MLSLNNISDNEVFEFKCSQGLLFDISRQICDFKTNVNNCDVTSGIFYIYVKSIYVYLYMYILYIYIYIYIYSKTCKRKADKPCDYKYRQTLCRFLLLRKRSNVIHAILSPGKSYNSDKC